MVTSSGILVVDPSVGERASSWAAFDATTTQLAADLRGRGLGPGDVTVVAGVTAMETLAVLFASWRCGAAVSVVAAGRRWDPAVVAGQISQRVGQLSARAVHAPRSVVTQLHRDGIRPPITCDGRIAGDPPPPADGRREADELAAWLQGGPPGDRVAIYQPTSGTTGEQRLVPVTWRMLRTNVAAIAARLDLGADDSFVSWMPLYHDMGLIAYVVMPALLGARLTLLPPEVYATAPHLFPELIERRRGTMTGCPNASLALLQRALRRTEPYDLSSMRRLVCGAEMIDLDLCEATLAAGDRHGLPAEAFSFAYGMAEATLAVSLAATSVPALAEEPPGWERPGVAPAHWVRPLARGFARTGPPVDGIEVRVVDVEARRELAERQAGEIEIRGRSVMGGYVGCGPVRSGLSGRGWLRTGDLGLLSAGQVVVVGRLKDVVIVGGRNILPDDVERIVGSVPGIRPGRVAAVPVPGRVGEALGVLAERSDQVAVDERRVRAAVRRELGVAPERVRILPRGTLPKTTSGKLRRVACRDLLEPALDQAPDEIQEEDLGGR